MCVGYVVTYRSRVKYLSYFRVFRQVYDMMDEVKQHLYEVDTAAVEEDIINVAIVGRPNVGK